MRLWGQSPPLTISLSLPSSDSFSKSSVCSQMVVLSLLPLNLYLMVQVLSFCLEWPFCLIIYLNCIDSLIALSQQVKRQKKCWRNIFRKYGTHLMRWVPRDYDEVLLLGPTLALSLLPWFAKSCLVPKWSELASWLLRAEPQLPLNLCWWSLIYLNPIVWI